MPMPSEGLTREEEARAGFIPGLESDALLGPYDPPEHWIPPKSDRPDDIWEEREGVMSRYQPSTLLAGAPRLWRPYMSWSAGVHELDDNAIERRSGVEVEAILTLSAAKHRSMMRGVGDG